MTRTFSGGRSIRTTTPPHRRASSASVRALRRWRGRGEDSSSRGRRRSLALSYVRAPCVEVLGKSLLVGVDVPAAMCEVLAIVSDLAVLVLRFAAPVARTAQIAIVE